MNSSIKQLHVFFEFFDRKTAVVWCNYGICLIQLLPMFDKTAAVVRQNNYSCSVNQLQLFDQATAGVRSTNCGYSFLSKLELFDIYCKTALVPSAVQ
jgi:hypothetical protein